jgi:hypothetical protein
MKEFDFVLIYLNKKLKELFDKNIEDLKYYNKVKRTASPKKEKIKLFADNDKYEFYCLEDGNIYIKNREEVYLYIDEVKEKLNNSHDDLEKILEERRKILSNKRIIDNDEIR